MIDAAVAEGLADVRRGETYGPFERVEEMKELLSDTRSMRLEPLFHGCHGLQLTLCADSAIGISSIDADGWARDGGRDG